MNFQKHPFGRFELFQAAVSSFAYSGFQCAYSYGFRHHHAKNTVIKAHLHCLHPKGQTTPFINCENNIKGNASVLQ